MIVWIVLETLNRSPGKLFIDCLKLCRSKTFLITFAIGAAAEPVPPVLLQH